jgi:hypothetical protein
MIKSNKNNILIGICGLIGSGKDTAAEYLVKNYNFQRESFAGSLKDAVSSIFGWERKLLEGLSPEDRLWREQVDRWWADRLNIPDLTPRWVLQYWGTEVCRIGFHFDIWIASLENRLRNYSKNVVVSDLRFPNEIDAIHNSGGIILRIKRGEDPQWYHDAIIMNQGPHNNPKWTAATERINKLGIHSSETAWAGRGIDYTIENNGSLEDLFAKLEQFIKDLESGHLVSKVSSENKEDVGN